MKSCPICNGTGVVTRVLSVYGEPPDYEPEDCPQCNGTGEAEPNNDEGLETEVIW